jgi:hypothetical protein
MQTSKKDKKTFVCSSCKANHAQWYGRCSKCNSWNTINEEVTKNTKSDLDEWFDLVRIKLTGKCACGCGNKSQKNDDKYFKHSCSHIFPKAKFDSIKCHPMNFVERAFWGGCHGVMDDTSIDKWVEMKDWHDIKRKFNILAPLIPPHEKANKFYTQLETLVKNN